MITPSNSYKVYVAVQPVDFRKGMDGLAAIIQNEFKLDPFCGTIFVFRAKRADRLKLVIWDGTGLVLVNKHIESGKFAWPSISDGLIKLSRSQFEALFEGIEWRNISHRRIRAPARV